MAKLNKKEAVYKGIDLLNIYHKKIINQEKPNILDLEKQINLIGFLNLEEFFKEKKKILLKETLNNKIRETFETEQNFFNVLANDNNIGALFYYHKKDFCVYYGGKNQYINTTYCKENNIEFFNYDSNANGGAIITGNGDLSMKIVLPVSIDITKDYLIENIANILKKYFLNVSINNNDILIDGLKVFGAASKVIDNIIIFLCYFSFSDKKDIILNICGEPNTGKNSGFLNSNYLNIEQLKKELLLWLQNE